MNDETPGQPVLRNQSTDTTWIAEWTGEAGGTTYRLSSPRRGEARSLTRSWRNRHDAGVLHSLPVIHPERFGLVRTCATWQEFETVVREYLDHGPHHKHYPHASELRKAGAAFDRLMLKNPLLGAVEHLINDGKETA